MTAMPLFDAAQAERAATEGRQRVGIPSWHHAELELAQNVARRIAWRQGTVTADDVVQWYALHDINLPLILGPAMGSLFKGGGWEWTGEVVKSERVSRHANLIRVWRLAE